MFSFSGPISRRLGICALEGAPRSKHAHDFSQRYKFRVTGIMVFENIRPEKTVCPQAVPTALDGVFLSTASSVFGHCAAVLVVVVSVAIAVGAVLFVIAGEERVSKDD